jgi:4-hydroxy-4-methyl-2-oxoglutarate aldolase
MSVILNPMPPQVSAEHLALLRRTDTVTIGHRRLRGMMDIAIQSIVPGSVVVGTAVTLQMPDRDSAVLHHAVGLLRPGDILVIDRLHDRRYACLGGGVAYAAQRSGCLGAIIDGPATDPEELVELPFPVWCRGIAQVTTRPFGDMGFMNVLVSVGGVPVQPGDAVLADSTGVLVLSPDEVKAVANEALGRSGGGSRQRLEAGEPLGQISGATQRLTDTLARLTK